MTIRRSFWAIGVFAMFLELVVAWGIPSVIPDHSLLHDYISTAGATDAPSPASFAMLGMLAITLHLVFVAGLWWQRDDRIHQSTVLLFAGFFLFLGIGLFFQCDPGCALETAEAWTHFAFGLTAFFCLGVAALLSAMHAWRCGDTPLFAAATALVILDLLLLLSDQTRIYRGLTERLTIMAMMAWSITWAVRLSGPEKARTPSTAPQ